MGLISVGASLPLELQLHDGATGKFPVAHVYDQAGAAVTGSPFSLTHLANGMYRNTAYTVLLANSKLVASYIVYNEVGHTTESVFHTRATDHWDVETQVETVNTKLGTPAGASVSADIAAIKAETASIQADTNDIQTKIGSPVGTLASDIAGVQSDTNDIQAKIGIPVGTLASDIASVQADTDDLQAKIGTPTTTVADKVDYNGLLLGTVLTRIGVPPIDLTTQIAGVQADTDDIQAKIGTPVGTVSSDIAAIQADTDDIQSKIGSPVATVSADIAAVKAETASIQGDTNDIQVKIGSPVGTLASDIAGVQADTDALQIAVAAVNTDTDDIQAKIGIPVTSLSADIAAVKAETASIQVDTDDIQSKIGIPVSTVSGDIAAVKAETASIQTDTNDIQAKIGTPVGTVSSDIASVQSDTNDIQVKIGIPVTSLAGDIAAVQADTDDIQSKIGSPVVTVSADLAAVKAETASIQSDTNDIQVKIGSPVGTLASDIAGVQADTDALQIAVAAVNTDTDDIQAKIGIPLVSVSADIAAVKAETASIQLDTNDIQAKIGAPVGTLASDLAAIQADTDDLQAKIGSPVGTLASDLASVQADTDDIQSKIGSPVVTVSADLAAVKAETASIQSDTNDIQVKIGSPVGTLASDIAGVQADTDALQIAVAAVNTDTDDIQAKIGIPLVSVSADIAAVKAETASIQLDTNDIQSKIGSPVGTLASDLAAIQADTDDLQAKIGAPVGTLASDIAGVQADTNDIQAKIGSPVGTVSSDIASVKSDSAAIKVKTDQLTFTGANVNANAQVVSDKTDYALTTAEKNDIADRVWDEAVSAHTLPGTYGLYVDVIRQFAVANNAELLSGSHGLSALKADIAAEGLSTRNEVDANETKIDAIIPAIVSARNTIVAEVDQNQLLIGAVSTQLSSVESNLTGEMNQNEAKIDTIDGKIGTIQNNTTVRFIVPDRLIKPDVGSKTYEFRLYLYDTNGNPEAPDTAPLIRIRRLDTGLDIVVGAVMTQDGAKVGAYYYQHTITSGTAEAHLLVETTVVEGGVTRYYPATSEITEFESDLNAIQSQISAVQSTVTSTDLAVQNPIFGLAALKSGQTAIVGEINQNEVLLGLIKGKTDLIPANIATQADVAAVGAAVLTRPDIAAIQVRLDLLRDNLKGIDGRDLTQVYDKWDISTVAKTSDPRFAYLDAAISSRGTLTAAQVWGYSSRVLTAYGLDPAAIDAIWAYLTSQATTPNSIGKRIADFLDVAVSSRATAVQVTAALAGVAQETTLNALSGTVVTEANQNEIKLNQVLADTATIKAKTNNLPSDPASQSLVQNTKSTLQSDIANLDLKVTGVKAKTDNLPVDPAKETSVQARPTNPVLTTDPRLNRLDVNVSSRGTVMAADLTPLAKTSEVNAAKTQVISEINANETKIDNVQATANQIKAKTDTIPTNPASFAHINQAEVNILDAIDDIPGGGGGATPAQIWSYASRTLTQDPSTFGPDISGLAEKTDLTDLAKTQYVNRMTTSFNNLTSMQEILAWAEQDGQRILGENCVVTVKDHLGATVWTGTLATPSPDGIFRFQNNMAATGDSNYYVEIDIEVDGDIRRSRQTFVTVG